ncbi:hypothetical protein SI65_06463 [Aspergillus cristatus]|uniref:Dickkopf N-terminal cysteine-rich domain-containing protein n=1 Tax=Aspergillus cristatus TaxID=573508 RepID=A0A1E3B9N9_ASPCR|nr:hypothetical protein SI65_06463 [Aspergillus cristatus]
MHFLSIILTAAAVSLANASALPPVDHSDIRLNPATTPALAARQPLVIPGIPTPVSRENDGAQCGGDLECKSNFCKNGRCAINQCKTDQDCPGQLCSRNGKCITGQLHDNHACEQDNQCRSGKCGNGKCTPGTGYYGARCSSARECNAGLICTKSEYFAGGERSCLDPKISGGGQAGNPCERNSDCQKGLECTDQRTPGEKLNDLFGGFGRPQQDPRDHFLCTKPPQEQCTGLKRACITDSQCCSRNCKTTEIFFIKQCEE